MEIYVGSLPFKWKDKDLLSLFEPFGIVASAKIVIDNITRQNKGFGFVNMPNYDEAKTAIQALNGSEVLERKISVTASVSKEEQRKQLHRAQVRASKKKKPNFKRGGNNDIKNW